MMVEVLEVIIITAITAIVTFIVTQPLKALFRRIKRFFVSKEKTRLDLSGNWYGVWETTTKGKPGTYEEMLKIKQRGENLMIQNMLEASTKGEYAYSWNGIASVYEDRYIIGSYKGVGVVSKGAFYFCLDKLGKYMIGKWVGVTADFELADGYWVVARKREIALEKFKELKQRKSLAT